MAPKRTILEKMRANPLDNWTIDDVLLLCEEFGLNARNPNGGSHYVVTSKYLRDDLTVPYKRPIKQRYIKNLVGYVIAHNVAREKDDGSK